MGASDTLAYIGSGVVTGGVRRGFDGGPDGGVVDFIKGAAEGATFAGISKLDLEGFQYPLAVGTSLAIGAITKGAVSKDVDVKGELTKAFISNKGYQKLCGEIAFQGIQNIGEAFGVNPMATSIAGLGIRSGFYDNWQDIFTYGAINLGLSAITQEIIGQEPSVGQRLLASGVQSAFSGLILGGVNYYRGNGSKGFVESVKLNLLDAVLDPLTFGTYSQPATDPYYQIAYLGDVLSFVKDVDEKGFGEAFGFHTADIWTDQAVKNLVNAGKLTFDKGYKPVQNSGWMKKDGSTVTLYNINLTPISVVEIDSSEAIIQSWEGDKYINEKVVQEIAKNYLPDAGYIWIKVCPNNSFGDPDGQKREVRIYNKNGKLKDSYTYRVVDFDYLPSETQEHLIPYLGIIPQKVFIREDSALIVKNEDGQVMVAIDEKGNIEGGAIFKPNKNVKFVKSLDNIGLKPGESAIVVNGEIDGRSVADILSQTPPNDITIMTRKGEREISTPNLKRIESGESSFTQYGEFKETEDGTVLVKGIQKYENWYDDKTGVYRNGEVKIKNGVIQEGHIKESGFVRLKDGGYGYQQANRYYSKDSEEFKVRIEDNNFNFAEYIFKTPQDYEEAIKDGWIDDNDNFTKARIFRDGTFTEIKKCEGKRIITTEKIDSKDAYIKTQEIFNKDNVLTEFREVRSYVTGNVREETTNFGSYVIRKLYNSF